MNHDEPKADDPILRALARLSEQVAENSRMLEAIIKHQNVPYEKQPMGFVKE